MPASFVPLQSMSDPYLSKVHTLLRDENTPEDGSAPCFAARELKGRP
jgi:hypothetical protein